MKHKAIKSASLMASLIFGFSFSAYAEIIRIDTPSTSLVLDAEKGKMLKFLYYGGRISGTDAENLKAAGSPAADAYPAYGLDATREAALSAVHSDGNMTLDLKVEST
ncbi:MAG: alpha-galactosidase, partial [Duncaniella sp.]|nr:alpha-galactosidase [Duncaniella sp.]